MSNDKSEHEKRLIPYHLVIAMKFVIAFIIQGAACLLLASS